MAGEQVVVDGVLTDVVDDGVIDDTIVDDDVTDVTDDDIIDDDVDDDDDGEKKAVEPWMADGDQQPASDVPVSTHIKMKLKLKGRLKDQAADNERLRLENETLRAGTTRTSTTALKRPVENDFSTITEYEEALGEYDQQMVDVRLASAEQKRNVQQTFEIAKAKLESDVDEHYGRAAKLIQENGIDTEVYNQADLIVRGAIESLMPGKGDVTTDQVISVLGDGSEKVIYYLGRNKNALNEFKSLLTEDKTGLKATLFLGRQKERLVNSKRKTSRAVPPGTKIKGDDAPTSAKASSLLKRRKAAVKTGNIQLAYDLKKQAKLQGVDVSNW